MASFPGIYRGVCVNATDPEGRRRVTLRVPQLFGEKVTDWAWPCVPPGWESALVSPDPEEGAHSLVQATPLPGEGVWVMFEAGNPEFPVWLGVF